MSFLGDKNSGKVWFSQIAFWSLCD